MARKPQINDFIVTVDGVGTFSFGYRTMRDEFAIQVEFARIIEGVEPTAWLQTVGGWLSALRVLTVRAPDGWDIDAMDPLDEKTYAKLGAVYQALIDRERSFRRGTEPAGESGGAQQAGDDRV